MRYHSSSCLCDICYRQKNPEALAEFERKQLEEIESIKKRKVIMQILGIPLYNDWAVHTKDLCDIFMDDEKCEALIAKLKNKAFW